MWRGDGRRLRKTGGPRLSGNGPRRRGDPSKSPVPWVRIYVWTRAGASGHIAAWPTP
jgi:hypothetical protein